MFIAPINFLAILAATVISMAIGMAWYSPFAFGKKWKELAGISARAAKEMSKKASRRYLYMAFASLITATVLSYIIGLAGAATVFAGIQVGFWVWLGFVAATCVAEVIFEKRPLALYVIDTSHKLLVFLVIGAILAVWR